MKKVVINKCFGGFGLSEMAYEKLIEWGVPVKKYIQEERGEDGRYLHEPRNEGEVIFDRRLNEDWNEDGRYMGLFGPYWETWISKNREHPLLIRVVEELGESASGRFADLKIVEIPDDVEYTVEEYDGQEHIAEKHKTWA